LFQLGPANTPHPRPFRVLGENLLPPRERQAGPQKGPQKDLEGIVESLSPDRIYWSKLEVPFAQAFYDLANDFVDDEGTRIYGEKVIPSWVDKLRSIAKDVFEEVTGSLDTHPRVLKAVALASKEFNIQLYHTTQEPEAGEEAEEPDTEEDVQGEVRE